MKFVGSILMGAALVGAPAAFAQTTPQTSPQTTPSPAPAPGAAAQATAVTDAEIDQFVTAALAVEKVRTDTTLAEADKNARMAAAVTGSGLTTDRFNAIGQAMQADPALNKRIQTAAAAKQSATPPAASGSTPPATPPGQ